MVPIFIKLLLCTTVAAQVCRTHADCESVVCAGCFCQDGACQHPQLLRTTGDACNGHGTETPGQQNTTCECDLLWDGSECLDKKFRLDWLYYFCQVIGWIYFAAWSVSFVPQCYLNWKRKSVVGLSFEYLVYNATGFLFYTTYSVVTYNLELAYIVDDAHHSVQPQDIAFGVFALMMTILTMIQCCIYERGEQVIDRRHVAIIIVLWVLMVYTVVLCALGSIPWGPVQANDKAPWTLMLLLGFSKTVISCVKNIPQAYMNYERKSTVGWSILNIMLDFTGGLLSFLQSFLNAWNLADWTIFTGNLAKIALSMVSIVFDLIFLTQHYVLYTDRADPDAGADPAFDYVPIGSGTGLKAPTV